MSQHQLATAFEQNWGELQNGELLRVAEAVGFDAMVTTDQNLRYQQNLTARKLATPVLLTTDWRLIRDDSGYFAAKVDGLVAVDYVELPFPAAP